MARYLVVAPFLRSSQFNGACDMKSVQHRQSDTYRPSVCKESDERQSELRQYRRLCKKCGAITPILIVVTLLSVCMLIKPSEPRQWSSLTKEQRSLQRFEQGQKAVFELLRFCGFSNESIKALWISLIVISSVAIGFIVFLILRRSPTRRGMRNQRVNTSSGASDESPRIP